MNGDTEAGQWNQIADAVRERYKQITHEDLSRVQGNIQQLIGLVQQRTGESRELIEQYVRTIGDKAAGYVNRVYESTGELALTAADSLRDSYGRVSGGVTDGVESAKDSIQRRPMESVLTAFGVGVFAGVVAGLTFGSRRR